MFGAEGAEEKKKNKKKKKQRDLDQGAGGAEAGAGGLEGGGLSPLGQGSGAKGGLLPLPSVQELQASVMRRREEAAVSQPGPSILLHTPHAPCPIRLFLVLSLSFRWTVGWCCLFLARVLFVGGWGEGQWSYSSRDG